jgi:hypothetical protein
MSRVHEPATHFNPAAQWGIVRSAHASSDGRVFPSILPYVLSPNGCRRIAGRDAPHGAVDALRRHATRAEQIKGEGRRKAA